MILSNCFHLKAVPASGVWYRVIQPRFAATPLHTSHTRMIPSRFNAGTRAVTPFRTLYLSENPMLALFEVQALLGSPMTPGGVVPHPRHPWTIINVKVNLRQVADLTDVLAHGSTLHGIDMSI